MGTEVKSVPSDDPNNYCRLCFADRNLVTLHRSNESPRQYLLNEIFICTGIEIEASETRPCSICWRCAVAVEDFQLFRKRCLANDAIVRSKYSRTTVRQGKDEWFVSIPASERPLDSNDGESEIKSESESMIPQVESGSSCDKYSSREEGDELSTEDTQSTKFAPPTCHLCSQLFTSRQTLYVHVREQHSGDRRLHKCGVCQATFKRKGHLEDHMSSHTGECRYSCKHCEAKFTRPKTLMRHRKSCSKEHPLNTQPLKRQSPLTEGQFQCEFCPKSFKHRPSLNFHIKSHYELLPYGCELCDARFVNDKGLLIHRGKYHANVPNEGTPARKTSPAPMQPKTGVQCAYCPRHFKEQRYLTQHIKFIHTARGDDQEKSDSAMAEGYASEQDQDDDNMEAVTIKFEVEENDSNFEEIMY